jgi:(4S)-4-hydroxy-5-phosphonooxypentane-2,3-dione isomerase
MNGKEENMLVVHVHVKVKPDCIDAFKEVTTRNARESVKEPGIARFDVMQQADDPGRFVLIEAYRSPEAATAHKATAHYAEWRDRMESLMAEPRYSVKFSGVFPSDESW